MLGLLKDGREDHATDLLLEEGETGDNQVSLGEIHVAQDLIHAVGTVVDDGDAAVSYTHLDVYKRQQLLRSFPQSEKSVG